MNMIRVPSLSGSRSFADKIVKHKYLTVAGYSAAVCLLFSATAFNSALASRIDFSDASDFHEHLSSHVKTHPGKGNIKWEVKHGIAEVDSPSDFDEVVSISLIGFEHALVHANVYSAEGFFHESEMGGETSRFDDINSVSAVPVPAAVWLFGSGLVGLVAISRKSERSSTVKF